MPMIPLMGQNTVPDGDAALLAAFSEQAYTALSQKFPALMDKVATFKVLESDLATNKAFGVFIIIINGNALYIPVIMGENALKPMMLFYFRKKDQFLPLSTEWIRRVTSETPTSIGQPAHVPVTAEGDFNLSNIFRAPGLLGRFSYASAVDILEKAPNGVKLAFEHLLKSNDSLLEKAYNVYGPDGLARALRLVKEAAAEDAGVHVFTDFVGDDFVETFGQQKTAAFNALQENGFAVKDNRKGLRNRLIKVSSASYTAIREPGFYEVATNKGTRKIVYAIPKGFSNGSVPSLRRYVAPGTGASAEKYNSGMYYVTDGGVYITSEKDVLGKHVEDGASEAFVRKMRSGDTPRIGAFGVFAYRKDNNSVVFSPPINIRSITESDGVKTYTSNSETIVLDPKVPVATFKKNKASHVTQAPPSAIFIELGEQDWSTILASDPAEFMRIFDKKVVTPIKVASHNGMYSINGGVSVPLGAAVEELLSRYNLGHSDVNYIKCAADAGVFRGLVAKRSKKASIFDGVPEGQPVDVDPTQYMPFEDPGMLAEQQMPVGGADMGMGGQEEMPTDGAEMGMAEEQPMPEEMDPYAMPQAPQAPVSYLDDVTLMPGMDSLVANMSMNDPGLLDAAVVTSLAKVPVMRDLVMSYVPNLRSTLDNLGRLLLAVWINENKVRESAGSLTYSSIEDNLVNAFNTLGTALLRLYDTESQLGM